MHVTETFLLLLSFSKFLNGCYPNRKCFDNKELQVYFEHFENVNQMVCCHSKYVVTKESNKKLVYQWIVNLDGLSESKGQSNRKFVIERCRFSPDFNIKSVIEGLNLVGVIELELIRVQPNTQRLFDGLNHIRNLSLIDLTIASFSFLILNLSNLSTITLKNVKVLDWFDLGVHQSLKSISMFDTNLTIVDLKALLRRRGLQKLYIEFNYGTIDHNRNLTDSILNQDDTESGLSELSLVGYSLKTLNVDSFLGGSSLITLNLSSNLIEKLPE